MKFRKKPVVIDAIQNYGRANLDPRTKDPELQEAIKGMAACDAWLSANRGDTKCWYDGHSLMIETLEGTMTASAGDWIIRGIKGELYPCRPDIFEATYEPVEEVVDFETWVKGLPKRPTAELKQAYADYREACVVYGIDTQTF